jgi:heptosyltransferase-2
MNRILVVLPNWFGETLFTTPFLRLLRAQHAGAFIATLGRPACRDILLQNLAVNEVMDFESRGKPGGPAEAWRLLCTLRAKRFDTAFILRRSLSRTALLALAGIRERVGFDNPKSGWLLTRRVAPLPQPAHKSLSYLPLLGVSVAATAVSCDYTVTEDERRAARALLETARLNGAGPLVVLHPGANWFHKCWPPERFAQLGDRLAASHQARLIITGGPQDAVLAASVQRAMREPAAVLAGRTSLRQLAACLEQAQLIVSNDTGILHLAAALQRPLVGLYGPTSPALTGPLGERRRIAVLHHPDCCPRIPCFQPAEGPTHPGMEAISVDEAHEAACNLLDQHD